MKTTRRNLLMTIAAVTVILTITITGCNKDKVLGTTTYNLKVKDVLGVTGTVTFTETASGSTTVDITLTGAASGIHPAHIHFKSAVETGGIAKTLTDVDATGKSSTNITQLDNGTPVTYADLIAFDGYVNVHESSSNLGTIIAQGDIGGNALLPASSTTNKSYDLDTVGNSGVKGTALFEKRVNGNTLLTITLTGTIPGQTHPAHIHLGSVTTVGGGPIRATLSSVDGATGKSYTTIRNLDVAAGGAAITYDDWLLFDGYINIHESSTNLGTIISQGNIGNN